MEKISDNSTQEQPQSFTSKETNHETEALHTVNKTTPLYFGLRINGQYYISYEKSQFWMLLLRSLVWMAINITVVYVFDQFETINQTVKDVVKIGLILQNVLHFILCFLDPGTIFQDEDDSYHEDRVYCQTCSLYRLRSSKHCVFCNKCVQKYDHHCGVFGKCIGRRNLIPFWLFIMISGLEGPILIILFAIHILSQQQL